MHDNNATKARERPPAVRTPAVFQGAEMSKETESYRGLEQNAPQVRSSTQGTDLQVAQANHRSSSSKLMGSKVHDPGTI